MAEKGAVLAQKPWLLQVPSEHASVEEFHAGKNGRLVVHLQDPHSNFGGQEHLAETLGALAKNHNLSLVLAEGGVGESSLLDVRGLLPRAAWRRLARRWLREARISGEEYWNLTSEKPLSIVGIENLEDYFKSVNAYARLARRREAALDYLRKIRRAVQDLKHRSYPEDLVEYEGLTTDGFESSERLDRLSEWMGESPLSALRRAEKKIDFTAARLEIAALCQTIRKSPALPASTRPDVLFAHLQKTLEIARENKIDLARFPQLTEYARLLERYAAMDWGEALEEIERAENRMYSERLPDRVSKVLRSIDRYTALLESAFSIRMTSKEFAEFEANEKNFATFASLAFLNRRLSEEALFEDLVPYRKILEEGKKDLRVFYASVGARDEAFVENAEKAMAERRQSAAFLVAGGYHTEHLKKLFAQKGYSFAVLRPVIESETNARRYEERLLEPAERFRSSEKDAALRLELSRQNVRVAGAAFNFQAGARLAAARDPGLREFLSAKAREGEAMRAEIRAERGRTRESGARLTTQKTLLALLEASRERLRTRAQELLKTLPADSPFRAHWMKAAELPWEELVRYPDKDPFAADPNQIIYWKNQHEARLLFLEYAARAARREPGYRDFLKLLSRMNTVSLRGLDSNSVYTTPSQKFLASTGRSAVLRPGVLRDEWALPFAHRLLNEYFSNASRQSLSQRMQNIFQFYAALRDRYRFDGANLSLNMNIANTMRRLGGREGLPHGQMDINEIGVLREIFFGPPVATASGAWMSVAGSRLSQEALPNIQTPSARKQIQKRVQFVKRRFEHYYYGYSSEKLRTARETSQSFMTRIRFWLRTYEVGHEIWNHLLQFAAEILSHLFVPGAFIRIGIERTTESARRFLVSAYAGRVLQGTPSHQILDELERNLVKSGSLAGLRQVRRWYLKPGGYLSIAVTIQEFEQRPYRRSEASRLYRFSRREVLVEAIGSRFRTLLQMKGGRIEDDMDRRYLNFLVRTLDDPDPWVARAAVSSLGRIVPFFDESSKDLILAKYFQILESRRHEVIRSSAARGLRRLREFSSIERIVGILKKEKSEEVQTYLLEALEYHVRDFRAQIRPISFQGFDKLVSVLREKAGSKPMHGRAYITVRVNSIKVMGELQWPDDAVIAQLRQMVFGEQDAGLQEWALRTLAILQASFIDFPNGNLEPFLRDLLRYIGGDHAGRPNPDLNRFCRELLEKFSSGSSDEALKTEIRSLKLPPLAEVRSPVIFLDIESILPKTGSQVHRSFEADAVFHILHRLQDEHMSVVLTERFREARDNAVSLWHLEHQAMPLRTPLLKTAIERLSNNRSVRVPKRDSVRGMDVPHADRLLLPRAGEPVVVFGLKHEADLIEIEWGRRFSQRLSLDNFPEAASENYDTLVAALKSGARLTSGDRVGRVRPVILLRMGDFAGNSAESLPGRAFPTAGSSPRMLLFTGIFNDSSRAARGIVGRALLAALRSTPHRYEEKLLSNVEAKELAAALTDDSLNVLRQKMGTIRSWIAAADSSAPRRASLGLVDGLSRALEGARLTEITELSRTDELAGIIGPQMKELLKTDPQASFEPLSRAEHWADRNLHGHWATPDSMGEKKYHNGYIILAPTKTLSEDQIYVDRADINNRDTEFIPLNRAGLTNDEKLKAIRSLETWVEYVLGLPEEPAPNKKVRTFSVGSYKDRSEDLKVWVETDFLSPAGTYSIRGLEFAFPIPVKRNAAVASSGARLAERPMIKDLIGSRRIPNVKTTQTLGSTEYTGLAFKTHAFPEKDFASKEVLAIGASLLDAEFVLKRFPKARITFVDVRRHPMVKIRDKFRNDAGRMRFFRADARALDKKHFPDGSYDFIYVTGLDETVYAHGSARWKIDQMKKIAGEEMRLLKNHGVLFHRHPLEMPGVYYGEEVKKGLLAPLAQAGSGVRAGVSDYGGRLYWDTPFYKKSSGARMTQAVFDRNHISFEGEFSRADREAITEDISDALEAIHSASFEGLSEREERRLRLSRKAGELQFVHVTLAENVYGETGIRSFYPAQAHTWFLVLPRADALQDKLSSVWIATKLSQSLDRPGQLIRWKQDEENPEAFFLDLKGRYQRMVVARLNDFFGGLLSGETAWFQMEKAARLANRYAQGFRVTVERSARFGKSPTVTGYLSSIEQEPSGMWMLKTTTFEESLSSDSIFSLKFDPNDHWMRGARLGAQDAQMEGHVATIRYSASQINSIFEAFRAKTHLHVMDAKIEIIRELTADLRKTHPGLPEQVWSSILQAYTGAPAGSAAGEAYRPEHLTAIENIIVYMIENAIDSYAQMRKEDASKQNETLEITIAAFRDAEHDRVNLRFISNGVPKARAYHSGQKKTLRAKTREVLGGDGAGYYMLRSNMKLLRMPLPDIAPPVEILDRLETLGDRAGAVVDVHFGNEGVRVFAQGARLARLIKPESYPDFVKIDLLQATGPLVTSLLRNPTQLYIFYDKILPAILNAQGANKKLKISILGASTGEEVVSIYFALKEAFDAHSEWGKFRDLDLVLFVNDLDDEILSQTKRKLAGEEPFQYADFPETLDIEGAVRFSATQGDGLRRLKELLDKDGQRLLDSIRFVSGDAFGPRIFSYIKNSNVVFANNMFGSNQADFGRDMGGWDAAWSREKKIPVIVSSGRFVAEVGNPELYTVSKIPYTGTSQTKNYFYIGTPKELVSVSGFGARLVEAGDSSAAERPQNGVETYDPAPDQETMLEGARLSADDLQALARTIVGNPRALEELVPFHTAVGNVGLRIPSGFGARLAAAAYGISVSVGLFTDGGMPIGSANLSPADFNKVRQLPSRVSHSSRSDASPVRPTATFVSRNAAWMRLAGRALVPGGPVVIDVPVDRAGIGDEGYEAVRLQVQTARDFFAGRGENNIFVRMVSADGKTIYDGIEGARLAALGKYKAMFAAPVTALFLSMAQSAAGGFMAVEPASLSQGEIVSAPYAPVIVLTAAVARTEMVSPGDPLDAALDQMIPLQYRTDRSGNFSAMREVKTIDLGLYSGLTIRAERFPIEELLEELQGARLALGTAA